MSSLDIKLGTNVTSGCNNIFLGSCAGGVCAVTGSNNIAMGCLSGKKLTSGSANVFIGDRAGCNISSESGNTFIGGRAGQYSSGNRNTLIGCGAGLNMSNGVVMFSLDIILENYYGTPVDNSAIGHCTLMCLNGGDHNAVLGTKAGEQTVAGSCNLFLGMCADILILGCSNTFLGYQSGNTNTTGCCNVAIGRDVELPSATGNHQFAIGDGTNRWITGDSNFKIYDKDGNEITGGGGGGGAPEFYTGITSSVQVAPLSYEVTMHTFPSTSGKQYVIESINVANVDSSVGIGTTINIIASIEDGTDAEQTYMAYNVPIVTGGLIELLKNPIVAVHQIG